VRFNDFHENLVWNVWGVKISEISGLISFLSIYEGILQELENAGVVTESTQKKVVEEKVSSKPRVGCSTCSGPGFCKPTFWGKKLREFYSYGNSANFPASLEIYNLAVQLNLLRQKIYHYSPDFQSVYFRISGCTLLLIYSRTPEIS